MRKIIFSCFLAILVMGASAYSQDKATEQEVSAMKALLEKKKMSENQVNKMLDNFREMPKMQRDNMMDQMKSGLKKNVPQKDGTGEIDGVQRGKPNMDDNGEIDGVQRGKPSMEDTGEIDGVQRGKPNMDQMKDKEKEMKDKEKEMKDKGKEMMDKGKSMKEEMKGKGDEMKEEMKGKSDKMKEKMNEMKSEEEKMNQSGKKDWSKISGKEFGKATSEWAKSRGKKYGQLKERVGKVGVRMGAANSKIEKAKVRLMAKKESGEISEEEYKKKMAQLADYEEKIKALDVKTKGKAELLEKVEEQASSINIQK